MESSEPCFFACFYGLLGILILCLCLFTSFYELCSHSAQNPGTLFRSAGNPVSLHVSIDWSEPSIFACFYEKLETLILCLFVGTHMYWLHDPNYELLLYLELFSLSAWNTGILFCSAWNPVSLPDSMDCLEKMFLTYFYGKLGTLFLCLFLWTARNPDSLPFSMDCLEPSLFTRFYELCSHSAQNPGTLFRSAGNPASLHVSIDWSEPSIFACFYENV